MRKNEINKQRETGRREQELKQIYRQLPEVLMPWFRENARNLPWREDKEPYHVWLSEIMLQQTRVEAVKKYYIRFLKELPSIEELAEAKEEKLLKLWEGLGYYSRAKNLQKAARIIVSENNGVFPSEYSEILTLPGIGEYTAGAIASNCFDQPVAAVDGNVLRVISRITESYEDILKPAVKRDVKLRLEQVYPDTDRGAFTQSLMELGAIICLPGGTPKCGICPLKDFCIARQNGTQMELPVKKKKKEKRIEERTVFVLSCKGKTALCRRSEQGLLAGMWEFPNVAGRQTAKQALATIEGWGCRPGRLQKELVRSHIFSHVRWDMVCFYVECECEGRMLSWYENQYVAAHIPLPTAFRQFWEANWE